MIELSIRKPVAVAVVVILVVMFGFLSLLRVPVQLTPDITKPQITVETRWEGASPHEIEREIVDEQEEQLKGVEGVERITSESLDSLGRIILEFPPGTDIDSALIKVSNRLEQVPEYPGDADKPVITTTNTTDNAMAWFRLRRLPDNETPIDSFYRIAEDVVKPRFERDSGVAASNVYGGREEELHVVVRPEALAVRGITISQVLETLDRENSNVSGGDFHEGKRRYKVRTVGEYLRPQDVENVVLETRDGKRVYLRDVAEVREGMKKRESLVRQLGEPTIALNCMRASGANVLDAMANVRQAVQELNEGILADRRLELLQVYDETDYIVESIDRVFWNLLLGSALAVTVLLLFLRSIASTFIVAVAIPISIVGSFVVMYLLGRSVNVISLAGMSFASGMVVDNAIVSLENIFRLRQEGEGRFEAALHGVQQVWGAILASTVTTIAVFLPVLFIEERAGQLFRDIAIAISCSVGLSLLVSVSVIPVMSARLMGRNVGAARIGASRGVLDRFRNRLAAMVGWVIRGTARRLATVVVLTAVPVVLTFVFLPEAEYLPQGNRNLAIGILLPPPGYNIDENERVGELVEAQLRRSMVTPETASAPAVAPAAAKGNGKGEREGGGEAVPVSPSSSGSGVLVKHFFFVVRGSSVFIGAKATEPEKASLLVPLMKSAVADLPGFISIVQQRSLFERGSGRRIDIEITGPDLQELVGIGGAVFGTVLELFPFSDGHQAIPIPSLDLQTPEIHVIPDRERAMDLGMDAREIGLTVDSIIDGTKASDYKIDGREVDLTVMGSDRTKEWKTQDLEDVPIYTPQGKLVSLGSLARIEVTRGPQQINHIERDRAITIRVVPSTQVPLETAERLIREQVVDRIEATGMLNGPYQIRLAGTVDDLFQAFEAFRWNFVLAVVITYLLMAALFESFLYPLVILFSVPLAAVGGVLCLSLVQSMGAAVELDILTMLGFVILVGVVVNNAILIVYRTLQGLRAGTERNAAIVEAVHTRVRPIFMTTLTSGCGMLPLVVVPGAGSELYRGLGSVVVGGLVLSTLFTIFLIPSLLSLVLEVQERLGLVGGVGGGDSLEGTSV